MTTSSRGLEVLLDGRVYPSDKLMVENSSQGNSVSGARDLFQSLAKIFGGTWVAELAAQLGGDVCIVDRERTNEKRRRRYIDFIQLEVSLLRRFAVAR